MVRVRLSRGGGKKRPYYHIVVVDQKSKRDGKCIERIGSYDPNLEDEKRITLKQDRLEYWLNQGAQMSDRVKLLQKYSLDPANLEKRLKIKTDLQEKNRIKKLKAKESQEAPTEESKAVEVPTEGSKAVEAPTQEAKAVEAKDEEVPVETANADITDTKKEKT